jgi:hypothetical protein
MHAEPGGTAIRSPFGCGPGTEYPLGEALWNRTLLVRRKARLTVLLRLASSK